MRTTTAACQMTEKGMYERKRRRRKEKTKHLALFEFETIPKEWKCKSANKGNVVEN